MRNLYRYLEVLAMVAITLLLSLGVSSCRNRNAGKGASGEESSLLVTPAPMLKELLKKGTPIFVSPEFISFIPADRIALVPSPAESREACGNPSLFYRLARVRHFSSVFLGSDQRSLPLGLSILESRLWKVREVNPWGILFTPISPLVSGSTSITSMPSKEWQLPSEASLQKLWPDPEQRATWMIGTASVLIAINHTDDAEQLLSLAEKTHRKSSELLETRASLSALRGRWEEAKSYARQALGKDHFNLAARMTLIRALIETGNAGQALSESRRLLEEMPPNEETLFLMARAASAAGSNTEEINALEKLVALGRKKNEPLGASLTYLGQAYGKNGERGNSLRTLKEALKCPELNERERSMIGELIDHLKIQSTGPGDFRFDSPSDTDSSKK